MNMSLHNDPNNNRPITIDCLLLARLMYRNTIPAFALTASTTFLTAINSQTRTAGYDKLIEDVEKLDRLPILCELLEPLKGRYQSTFYDVACVRHHVLLWITTETTRGFIESQS